jgi:hypothetical protein
MTYRTRQVAIALIVLTATSCVTTTLAPGAEKVRMTRNASDVANCKPVGSVHGMGEGSADVANDVRNRAFGLGGNVVFVTTMLGNDGVVYRCD